MAEALQSPAITLMHRGHGLRRLRAIIKPGWGLLVALVLVAVVAAPVIAVFAFVFRPTEGLWTHLVNTLLIEYVQNTILLGVGVAAVRRRK